MLARKGLLAQEVDVTRFWQHVSETGVEWGQQHPAMLDKSHRPMGLYGDDAQYDKNQNKLVIFTLNDVLSTAKHSMQSAWPLFVLREASLMQLCQPSSKPISTSKL